MSPASSSDRVLAKQVPLVPSATISAPHPRRYANILPRYVHRRQAETRQWGVSDRHTFDFVLVLFGLYSYTRGDTSIFSGHIEAQNQSRLASPTSPVTHSSHASPCLTLSFALHFTPLLRPVLRYTFTLIHVYENMRWRLYDFTS